MVRNQACVEDNVPTLLLLTRYNIMNLGRTLHIFNPSLTGVEDVARRHRRTREQITESRGAVFGSVAFLYCYSIPGAGVRVAY